MRNIKLIIFLIFIFAPFKLYALIEVDITRGNLNPLPIAVSSLYADRETLDGLKKEIKIDEIGEKISLVIENNLDSSLKKEYVIKIVLVLLIIYV